MKKIFYWFYKMTKITQQCAVYVLQMSDGRFYCGITNCIERRLKQHNAGKSKFTSKFLPVKLVWLSWCDTRKEAARAEKVIKQRGPKRWIHKYGNPELLKT